MREESGESQRNKKAGLPPPPPLPVEVGGGALGWGELLLPLPSPLFLLRSSTRVPW